MTLTRFPNGIFATPNIGGGGGLFDIFAGAAPNVTSNVYFVDADNGSDGNTGYSPVEAKATIQSAVTAAITGGVIYVKAQDIVGTETDPDSYEENIVIPAGTGRLTIIGVGGGRTQGGLPQLKVGATTTSPIITVRSPGVTLINLGINGAGATGGGIKIDDDGGTTYSAFGLSIINCHFKNCKGTGNASTGGAIWWGSNGGGWQTLIKDSLFFNNRAGIVLTGTGSSRPQDVVVENCDFYSSANTNVDADIYGAGGSGFAAIMIKGCNFGTVDVPAYATSPAAARYMDLTSCVGSVLGCNFACVMNPAATEVTFGAAGTAAKIPTTVRFANCWGESSSATEALAIARTA